MLAVRNRSLWILIPVTVALAACDSPMIREAKEAEDDGRIISNETMSAMHPKSFHPGSPAYLERDFEAGADFICDEIKAEYDRDICSEPAIDWR